MPSEYDAFAEEFSATREQSWPEFDKLKKHLQKGDRILDLGCGNGRLRKFLDEKLIPFGTYFALDVS